MIQWMQSGGLDDTVDGVGNVRFATGANSHS
jgi:hypothetical protein